MRFVDLAQHLHELRFQKTGRAIGMRMRLSEVWTAALDCPKNGISDIRYFETDLPRPFDGLFLRLFKKETEKDFAAIYVNKSLEDHFKEFAAIKELMHCWSPGKTYVSTPEEIQNLVSALSAKKSRYTANVASDMKAIFAAAEVILPHYIVEKHIALGHDHNQIAFEHDLHPEIAQMICSMDVLQERKNGGL
ncbi:hypothetical protein [Celeribacter sp. ULVN23_4]